MADQGGRVKKGKKAGKPKKKAARKSAKKGGRVKKKAARRR